MNIVEQVVANDLCIGCGGCAAIAPSRIRMELDPYGHYVPRLTAALRAEESALIERVCPFSGKGWNETDLGKARFSSTLAHHELLGFYGDILAGHANEAAFREEGSSGGLCTWLLSELKRTGEIDHVLHVKRAEGGGVLFAYGVSSSTAEIRGGAKSRYYAVEMSGVLRHLRDRPGAYAVVGVPCFIKMVRRWMREDPVMQARVKYCVGLFCGHLKTTKYAEMLAWQAGVGKDDLAGIDFRGKDPARGPREYLTVVTSARGRTEAHGGLFGTNWGYCFMRYDACDCCDDIYNETADVVFGDAWLPNADHLRDWRGNNLVLIRDDRVSRLFAAAMADDRVRLTRHSVADALEAQKSNIQHRRAGLAYRLARRSKQGLWSPEKRVQPDLRACGFLYRAVFRFRARLMRESKQSYLRAEKEGRYETFERRMKTLIRLNVVNSALLLRNQVRRWLRARRVLDRKTP